MEPLEVPEEVVSSLRNEMGEELRAVISYGADEYEEHYVREDVDTDYSVEQIEQFIDDLSLQGLSADHLESLFNAGSLQCTVFGFDDALMYHFVKNDFQGLFVTYDRIGNSNISEFIEYCQEYID